MRALVKADKAPPLAIDNHRNQEEGANGLSLKDDSYFGGKIFGMSGYRLACGEFLCPFGK